MKLYKLYPIIDWDYVNQYKIELHTIKSIIQNCNFYQLRIKNKPSNEIIEIIQFTKNYFPFAKLILNDYYQFIDYSNGLHLGIEDILMYQDQWDLKRLYPIAHSIEEWLHQQDSLIFGISTHNFQQFETMYRQYKQYLGYLAIGPCFETNTKTLNYSFIDPKEIVEILKFYQKETLKLSLVFIGGINQENVQKIHKWIKHSNLEIERIYYASISSFLKLQIPDKLYFT